MPNGYTWRPASPGATRWRSSTSKLRPRSSSPNCRAVERPSTQNRNRGSDQARRARSHSARLERLQRQKTVQFDACCGKLSETNVQLTSPLHKRRPSAPSIGSRRQRGEKRLRFRDLGKFRGRRKTLSADASKAKLLTQTFALTITVQSGPSHRFRPKDPTGLTGTSPTTL